MEERTLGYSISKNCVLQGFKPIDMFLLHVKIYHLYNFQKNYPKAISYRNFAGSFLVFFFIRGDKECIYARCVGLGRSNSHPTQNSPAFPPAYDPGTALALNFWVMFYRCSTPNLGAPIHCLLGFIRGLTKTSSSRLPSEKPRNALSPGYGRPGAYLL